MKYTRKILMIAEYLTIGFSLLGKIEMLITRGWSYQRLEVGAGDLRNNAMSQKIWFHRILFYD